LEDAVLPITIDVITAKFIITYVISFKNKKSYVSKNILALAASCRVLMHQQGGDLIFHKTML
jgi:hypothetical protein